MANYARFAKVYDQEAHCAVADAFHATLQRALARRLNVPLAVDLGCGSGLLTRHLARHAERVIGLDRSEAMLAIARRRCGTPKAPSALRARAARVSFQRADLTRPLGIEKCDLATACGEVMNHFLEPRVLLRVFQNVRAILSERGVFAFDAPTISCYELDWNDREYATESPRGDLLMECSYDAKRKLATARMISYERQEGGLYKKSSTVLRERTYTDLDFEQLLARAGFTSVRCVRWSPWPEQLGQQPLDRSMWLARPGRGTGAGARARR